MSKYYRITIIRLLFLGVFSSCAATSETDYDDLQVTEWTMSEAQKSFYRYRTDAKECFSLSSFTPLNDQEFLVRGTLKLDCPHSIDLNNENLNHLTWMKSIDLREFFDTQRLEYSVLSVRSNSPVTSRNRNFIVYMKLNSKEEQIEKRMQGEFSTRHEKARKERIEQLINTIAEEIEKEYQATEN